MLSWTAQKKLTYLIGTLAILSVLIYVPFLLFWYEAPTCFDGKQNNDETGIDCGGSCSRICRDDSRDPVVLWSRVFQVVPNVYSAVAYAENPNGGLEAPYAEYEFIFYNKDGVEIYKTTGTTFIPQGSRFAVYEGTVNFAEEIPERVTFAFTNIPSWRQGTFTSKDIVVQNKALLREETAPRIEATVANQSNSYISEAELDVIVYDALGKAVHSSRTVVEDLRPGENERVTFNWPMKFDTSLAVCSTPVDIAVLIDRSGSMKSDNENPPEPLTAVKDAAEFFIGSLTEDDRVSVVSFGTDATSHVPTDLTYDKNNAQNAVQSIQIVASSSGYTNLGGGLAKALEIFKKIPERPESRRAIVLLTDGIPTAPDDAEDPEKLTEVFAQEAHDANIKIYAIGLGTGVNKEFLESIVTEPASYRGATDTADLGSIYTSLAIELCQKKPAVIEIIPKPLPEIEF